MELQKYKLKEVTSELHGGDTISAKDIYTEVIMLIYVKTILIFRTYFKHI